MTTATRGTPLTRGGIRSELLTAADARWLEALSRLPHDVYHLPDYVALAARHQERGVPMAFLAEGSGHCLLIPLIMRDLPAALEGAPSSQDATSPRGFPGPVSDAAGPEAEAFLEEALASFPALLRDRGVVSAFIRLHPLLGPPVGMLRRHGTLAPLGDSFSIDLRPSEDALWGQMRANHRRDIRHAERAGYVARIDEAWSRFDGFIEAYGSSMERLGAAPHWRLSRDYFLELRRALRERVHLCVVEAGGQLAAACLLTEADGIAEYHLAASVAHHLAASPAKLLIRFASGWAKRRGHHRLHLAGTPRPGDSLSHFKAGFSTLRHPMHTWRVIADAAAYGRLVDRWQVGAGRPADGPEGWFPAYRSPTADGGA